MLLKEVTTALIGQRLLGDKDPNAQGKMVSFLVIEVFDYVIRG